MLKEELQKAGTVWLPMWALPHYDTYVEPAAKLYRDVRYDTGMRSISPPALSVLCGARACARAHSCRRHDLGHIIRHFAVTGTAYDTVHPSVTFDRVL